MTIVAVRRTISKRTTRAFDIRASRLNSERGLAQDIAPLARKIQLSCSAKPARLGPCRCRDDAGPGADGEHSGHAQIFIAGQLSSVAFLGSVMTGPVLVPDCKAGN
ncbi:hypothetical protein HJA93_15650 [Rhizobium binae]|nr:hypothetical protein [Rhizobium binae]